jgi:peptidyl-dipeptidase Dcp
MNAPDTALGTANPLLDDWTTPFGVPPFDAIRAGDFLPAFDVALAAHDAEIERLAADAAPPTFDNTVRAFEASGRTLVRIQNVFGNLTASATSPALQAVEREMAPRLAAHASAIWLNARLFARIDAVHAARAALPSEDLRLVERIHLDFVLGGARLDPAGKARLAAIVERLAVLTTRFSQNVLHDESTQCVWLRSEADLAGLPESLRAAARAAAQQRGEPDAWAITLGRSMVTPFLTHSERRDLREQAYRLWKARGEGGGPDGAAHDNRPVAREILALRLEQARLHGYASYADFALVDRMARTPAAVARLLDDVWRRARERAGQELAALTDIANETARAGGAQAAAAPIEPWDWRYWAERVRRARYALDDAQVKPYFTLDRMLAAAFDCAHRLFGLRFEPRDDIPVYHPDVRAFEVLRDGRTVGVFLSDNFARSGKRSGAWMSVYRAQSRHDGERIVPIVVNNNNFARAPGDAPTLLSMDDVRTLFHEFGHGLHGLLSDVSYERLAGTRVLRDFVELPSQLFEHWALEPAVLKRHARHADTGGPIPDELLERLLRARRFNQGFETVGYTACALIDMALHAQTSPDGVDIVEFERAELQRLGMPPGCSLYHRLPHFLHLFASAAYAAGYYVYLWAEVLDADAYGAFDEAGDPFDPQVAQRLHRFIYSSGNSLEPGDAYRAFRGRDASVEPLLRKRGLVEEVP